VKGLLKHYLVAPLRLLDISFYSSCVADLGLDVFEEVIAIIGNLEQMGNVVLAALLRMKKELGMKTRTCPSV